jgi:hypothetical protein
MVGNKPIYVQISEWLENEILCERIRENEKIYSQYQLAEMFNINPVLEEVISIQKEELEYALNVQNKMTDLILEGTGLKKVASEISKILQCPFLIVDSEHRILTKGYHNQKGSSLLNEVINNKQLCEELLESDKENPVQINNCQCFNIPVRSGKNVFGKLLLFRGRPFEKLELVAIDEISKAVMLILTQKIAKKEEMLRAQREFLDELLSGSIQDEEMALSRAEYFKIKVPHKIMAMVIETTKPHQQNTKSKRSEGYLKSKQNEIIKTIDSIMKYKINYLATTRGNLVIVLMEAGEDTEALAVHQAKEIGEKLAKEITAKIDNLDVFIAIGEQYDKLTKIHKSLGEALKTIQLGKIPVTGGRGSACAALADGRGIPVSGERGADCTATVDDGGIPVTDKAGKPLVGSAAVIDKDRAASLLAGFLGADILVIPTAVSKVCLNFRQPDQIELDSISLEEARHYLKQGHFAAGSMGPKIEAAVSFLEAGGKEVIITMPELIEEAVVGNAGTRIYSN